MRGLFDGITGTWLRQMSYSMCRFWAYDESKKLLGAGARSFESGCVRVGNCMRFDILQIIIPRRGSWRWPGLWVGVVCRVI